MKKCIKFAILISGIIWLTGCGPKSTANEQLPKNESVFTWWGERTERFPSYEYSVTDEKEALTKVTEEMGLEVLPSFTEARDLIKKDFLIEGTEQEPEEFFVLSEKDEFNYSSMIKFKNRQDEYTSYATITEQYRYLEDLKKVKLYQQRIVIYNATAKKEYNGVSLEETLISLGDWLKLDTPEKWVSDFTAAMNDSEQLKGKNMIVYDDTAEAEEQRLFGKIMGVEYDEFGTLKMIYAYTVDYRI